MSYDYDVIVVGARVAGASTAMLLARRGHRVLLIDRATMPADTVSTHAILRSGVLQLTRWGVLNRIEAAGTPPIRHITLGFGDDRIPFRLKGEYGVEQLYAPRRIVLDSALLDAAVDSGVELMDGTRVSDVLTEADGTVTGVMVSRRRRATRLTARIVIGADGVRSRVAKLVAAPTYRHHHPTNAVHYAYFTGMDASGFWFQFTPGVNAGLIPTNDGAVCVFVGRPIDRLRAFRADPETEFHGLLREAGADLIDQVSAGSRVSQFRGTNGLPGFMRQPSGPGWALVGDAGYTKDPISAHGISDAMRDAELCARAVDEALLSPESAAKAMSGYRGLRDCLSWRMFDESQALAGYRWDAQEASMRMRAISEAVRRECETLLALPEWSKDLAVTQA